MTRSRIVRGSARPKSFAAILNQMTSQRVRTAICIEDGFLPAVEPAIARVRETHEVGVS